MWMLEDSALAHLATGNIKAANQTIEAGLDSLNLIWRRGMANVLAKAGRVDEARKMLQEMEAMKDPNPMLIIPAYVALSEHEKAFEWLHRAIEERIALVLQFLRVDSIYDELRKDPRWDEVINHLEKVESQSESD